MCIFSSYSGDDDDSFHLHIAFHPEGLRSPSPLSRLLPSLSATFCVATENADCIITRIGQWGEEKPQSKRGKQAERKAAGAEGNQQAAILLRRLGA